MPGEFLTLGGAALGMVAVIVSALFLRRSNKGETDLKRVQMIFEEYRETIDDLKADVATLKKEMKEQQDLWDQERETSKRRIHALRLYVGQLLDFITSLGGTPPPEPKEPLD